MGLGRTFSRRTKAGESPGASASASDAGGVDASPAPSRAAMVGEVQVTSPERRSGGAGNARCRSVHSRTRSRSPAHKGATATTPSTGTNDFAAAAARTSSSPSPRLAQTLAETPSAGSTPLSRRRKQDDAASDIKSGPERKHLRGLEKNRVQVHAAPLFVRELRRNGAVMKITVAGPESSEEELSMRDNGENHEEFQLGAWRRRFCRLYVSWTGDFAGSGDSEITFVCEHKGHASEIYVLLDRSALHGASKIVADATKLPQCFKPNLFGFLGVYLTDGEIEKGMSDFVDVLLCSASDKFGRAEWSSHVGDLLNGSHIVLSDVKNLMKRQTERLKDDPEYWEGLKPVMAFNDMAQVPYFFDDIEEARIMFTARITTAEDMVNALCIAFGRPPSDYCFCELDTRTSTKSVIDPKQSILQLRDKWPEDFRKGTSSLRFMLCKNSPSVGQS